MAQSLEFFMTAEDERSFLRFLERFELEVYPLRIPPDWKPFPANEGAAARLPDGPAYLAATRVAPLTVDRVKRGPEKGHWHVDEIRSPVIYFERSAFNDQGELASGKLWAELAVTPQSGRLVPAPERFRQIFVEIETWMKKNYYKSEPRGFLVGPDAVRRMKRGVVLRDSARRGGTIRAVR
jgi:hypothetical protein